MSIIILSLSYLIINILTIKDGHNWCSDFGQYLGQAQNIIEHKEYTHTYYIGRSVVTPPGFPLILIPLLRNAGLDFRILKLPNVFFFLGFILILYCIMRKRVGEEDAFLGAVLLLTSPDFFIFKQYIMSDPAFLFFIVASIFSWLRYEEAKGDNNVPIQFAALIAATLLMCFAFFVRWAGIALFISMLIYFVHKNVDRRAVGFIVSGLISSFLIQRSFGTDGLNYYHEVALPFQKWLLMSAQAMPQTIKTLVIFFFPCKTNFTLLVFRVLNATINFIVPLFFGCMTFGFFYKIRKRSLTIIESFVVVYLLGNLVWYFTGGTRYLYPIIGFLVLFVIEGAGFLSRYLSYKKWSPLRLARLIMVFLVLHNTASILMAFDYDDDQIYKSDARDMVSWIQANTRADDKFVFGKPRELGFLTRRYMTSYLFLQERNLCERIRQLNISYFIFEDYKEKYVLPELNLTDMPLPALARNDVLIPFNIDTKQISLQDISACQLNVTQVWGEDREYKIYKVLKDKRF
jgi:hypothetical protein